MISATEFNPRRDMEKLNQILDWDGVRKANFAVDGAEEWSDEDLRNKASLSDDEIALFHKNLIDCQKDAKERQKDVTDELILEALSNCVKYDKSIFVNIDGVYRCGTPALENLSFKFFKNTNMAGKIADYVNYSGTVRTVDDVYTRYIKVGSKYFDTVDGIMVDTAPDEFRTFAINRDVNYTPLRSNEGKSQLIRDFNEYMGEATFDYLMHYVAWNLTDLRVNKKGVYVYGPSRTMKTTYPDILARIGLAPTGNYADEIKMGCEFQDSMGQALGIYVMLPCNDVETVNWTTVKSIHTDRTKFINQKGIAGYHTPTRAFLYMTTNEPVTTGMQGIAEKLIILKTRKSFWDKVKYDDADYIKKLGDDSYEEFINILLTYAAEPWSPFVLEGEVAEVHNAMMWDVAGHESFIQAWTPGGFTPVRTVYNQYIAALNDISESDAELATPDALRFPTRAPNGLSGKGYGAVRKALQARGFKIVDKKIKGETVKCFTGSSGYKPPVSEGEPEELDTSDLSDYQGGIEPESFKTLDQIYEENPHLQAVEKARAYGVEPASDWEAGKVTPIEPLRVAHNLEDFAKLRREVLNKDSEEVRS